MADVIPVRVAVGISGSGQFMNQSRTATASADDLRQKTAGTTLRPLRLRYWWASELDLMVWLAGLRLRERYQDWDRGPFTGESQDRIWVCEVTAAPAR